MRQRLGNCILLLLCIALPLAANTYDERQLSAHEQAWDKIHYTPIPAWVTPVEIPEGYDSEQWYGVVVLLRDFQFFAPSNEDYFHTAMKFETLSAVEQGSIVEIEFDPRYEEVRIHMIQVHRDGEAIDKLQNALVKVFQQETRADSLVYHGRQTITLFLSDVRAGDILEVAYSSKGIPSPLVGNTQVSFSFSSHSYVEKLYNRLVAPADAKIFFSKHRIDLEPEIQDLDNNLREWVWEKKNVEAATHENYAPRWYRPFARLDVSTFENWESVGMKMVERFLVPDDLSVELIAFIEEWKSTSTTEEEVLLKGIRFVQNQIRYLSLNEDREFNAPDHPNEVFERRYGDCKDKTGLILSICKYLGIEGWPALVHTSLGEKLDSYLPGFHFNHVIACFEFQEQIYFVDSTHSFQGGDLERLENPLLYNALLLKENGSELVSIPVTGGMTNYHRSLKYSINTKKNVATLHVESTLRGENADRARMYFQEEGIRSMRLYSERRYGNPYDGAKCTYGPIVEDHLDKNTFQTKASFLIEGFGQELGSEEEMLFFILPKPASWISKLEQSPYRQSPLALPFPFNAEERIEVQLLDALLPEDFEERNLEYCNQYVECSLNVKQMSRDRFVVDVGVWIKKNAIEVEDLEEFQDALEDFGDALNIVFRGIPN
ncbi:MAG: hypothetical protein KR126chlam1_01350 [Chlamydiae bacterium]|nr:hypothetical protein [Chlamydiota bacterium]